MANDLKSCITTRHEDETMLLFIHTKLTFDENKSAKFWRLEEDAEGVILKYLIDTDSSPSGTYVETHTISLYMPWDNANFPIATHTVRVELYIDENDAEPKYDIMDTKDSPIL